MLRCVFIVSLLASCGAAIASYYLQSLSTVGAVYILPIVYSALSVDKLVVLTGTMSFDSAN